MDFFVWQPGRVVVVAGAFLLTFIACAVLERFNRLFTSKGDAAVVALEHDVCAGCHMKVTTATAAAVRAGKEIVSCEQCGRILYSGS